MVTERLRLSVCMYPTRLIVATDNSISEESALISLVWLVFRVNPEFAAPAPPALPGFALKPLPPALGVTIRVSADKPWLSCVVMVAWRPWVMESRATMAAMPMIMPRVVRAALSLRSRIALNE